MLAGGGGGEWHGICIFRKWGCEFILEASQGFLVAGALVNGAGSVGGLAHGGLLVQCSCISRAGLLQACICARPGGIAMCCVASGRRVVGTCL
jgi:hypothetical protein